MTMRTYNLVCVMAWIVAAAANTFNCVLAFMSKDWMLFWVTFVAMFFAILGASIPSRRSSWQTPSTT